MKSGLEGRNNYGTDSIHVTHPTVSMKSGLEGRNNNKKSEFLTLRAVMSQ